MDACREIDVRVPIYISAGVDNTVTQTHPGWREIDAQGRLAGWNTSPLQAGFYKLCFNTPYLDYLCRQIEEAVTLFPEADGVFLDIINQGQCCCNWCMEQMAKDGLDPEREEHRKQAARAALDRYYKASTAACKIRDPAMPVFHNSGHVLRGRREIVEYQSHLELESLPTGGWGYDHFPESASYASHLNRDYLGMTGKFHTSWGEFGGFKHPNALRYECASMIAFGARCSVGDQLHPDGRLDPSTYNAIGLAYSEVAAREPWCKGTEAVANIAILSSQAENGQGAEQDNADTGASRVLLEGHQLFTLIDRDVDFEGFKLVILPDNITVDDALLAKISAYVAKGGKLLLTGTSGITKSGNGFALDIGAAHFGESPFTPDYVLPAPGCRASFVQAPMVMYPRSQRIKAGTGESLGQVFDPYFNRTYRHFCSHQHTPNRPDPSGYDAGVRHGNVVYLAHPVFTLYCGYGAVAVKEYVLKVIADLLGEDRLVSTNLPSTARITLRRQPAEERHIVHLFHANKALRGGNAKQLGAPAGAAIEVIEDLDPLHDITVAVRLGTGISRVTLEPQGKSIPYAVNDGWVETKVDSFTCHQMIVFHQ